MKLFLLALALTALNPTYSPDSTKIAYTIDNDLYVKDVKSGKETRLTFDGSSTVLNGRASWVYYEEIFGRSSDYRAFWWSPDSRKIAFYRFDESDVGVFPIYSPFGKYGSIKSSRYPKAGTYNPKVKVGIAPVNGNCITWVTFPQDKDCYYGTPFWDENGRNLYIQWEPRRQNELRLYKFDLINGALKCLYSEIYPTWVDWIDGMLFTSQGLYMARDYQSGWQQIYFLSYNGNCKQLTQGENWDIQLLRCDENTGDVWFLAKRDNPLHPTLYHLDKKGIIHTLTDPSYWTKDVVFSTEGKSFTALQSTSSTPWFMVEGKLNVDYKTGTRMLKKVSNDSTADCPLPEVVKIRNGDYLLYGLISYPRNFSKAKKYPVVMQLYGGPGTPYVRDRWRDRDASDLWCYRNDIIYIVVDPRSSGENGRRGLDEAYGRMAGVELNDYIQWAQWLQSQPYVIPDRIGVEGFSFGGTTTAMLVLRYPQYFRCGIAGGGVYDWTLYDTHYTERFMNLPSVNKNGYESASVINYIEKYGVNANYIPGALRITHGTADDNVHLQNTLLLVNALEDCGTQFELSLYPDGMHGYRGKQKLHSDASDHIFWKKYLLENK